MLLYFKVGLEVIIIHIDQITVYVVFLSTLVLSKTDNPMKGHEMGRSSVTFLSVFDYNCQTIASIFIFRSQRKWLLDLETVFDYERWQLEPQWIRSLHNHSPYLPPFNALSSRLFQCPSLWEFITNVEIQVPFVYIFFIAQEFFLLIAESENMIVHSDSLIQIHDFNTCPYTEHTKLKS